MHFVPSFYYDFFLPHNECSLGKILGIVEFIYFSRQRTVFRSVSCVFPSVFRPGWNAHSAAQCQHAIVQLCEWQKWHKNWLNFYSSTCAVCTMHIKIACNFPHLNFHLKITPHSNGHAVNQNLPYNFRIKILNRNEMLSNVFIRLEAIILIRKHIYHFKNGFSSFRIYVLVCVCVLVLRFIHTQRTTIACAFLQSRKKRWFLALSFCG